MNRNFLIFILVILFLSPASSAVFFSGTNQGEDCGTSSVLVPSDQITLSAWANTSLDNSNQALIVRSTTSANAEPYVFRLVAGAGGAARVGCQVVTTGGTFSQIITCGIGIDCYEENVWNHFACTWDSSDNLIVYVNGVSKGTTGSVTGSFSSFDSKMGFGLFGSGVYDFNGQITDVAVYDRGLTSAEIETLALSRKRNTISDGRIGYWPADDYEDGKNLGFTAGNDLIDRSGNGNDCAQVGGVIAKAEEWINNQ